MLKRSLAMRITVILAVGAFAALALWGCSDSDVTGPIVQNQADENLFNESNPAVREVMAVQLAHTAALMSRPDVIGTATTIDENGDPAVLVFVTSDGAKSAMPLALDKVKVITQITEPFVAMKGKPGGGGDGGGGETDHKALQSTPIKMGTSGGWRFDLANGYCCGGTLGALIEVGNGDIRILSNYHVFEADIVNGGNGTTAKTGDPIVHPALIDIGCQASNGIDVATLVVSSALDGSNVDCSSAKIINGKVDTSGAILEIGTISSQIAGAFIGQDVKKSGRTTGLGRAEVSGLNATVSITYENECAGGTAFTKTFTGQIVTTNKGSRFLAGGDSGSLMVEDITTNPRAIGLLFAGSRSAAIANPIDEVLSFFGNAGMVGQ
jgi:hypothetical protein